MQNVKLIAQRNSENPLKFNILCAKEPLWQKNGRCIKKV